MHYTIVWVQYPQLGSLRAKIIHAIRSALDKASSLALALSQEQHSQRRQC